jgi:hypothetical protein
MTAVVQNITVNMEEAYPLVMDILRAKLTPMLTSSPGVGKSALGGDVGENNKLCIIDCRLSQADPTDLNGFPMIITTDKTVNKRLKAGYIPMETFPIEGDEIPEGYTGWLILLDEFNSAPLAVQAAAYKLVLDRMVGMYKLHKNVAVMGAGNLSTDKAIVNRTGTAMQSRLIHLQIHVCPKVWGKWADRSNVDHRVKSFIKFKPDLLHHFDPNHTDLTFPCPRTWDFTSRLILPMKTVELTKLPLLAGTVGQGAAREFYAYTQIYGQIPTIEQILSDPERVAFGPEPSMHYALSGLVAYHMKAHNADILVKFIRRLGIDFQVVTLRSAITKDPEVKKAQEVKNWIVKNAQELL